MLNPYMQNLEHLLNRVISEVNISRFKVSPEEEIQSAFTKAASAGLYVSPFYFVLLVREGIITLKDEVLKLEKLISPAEIIDNYVLKKVRAYSGTVFTAKDIIRGKNNRIGSEDKELSLNSVSKSLIRLVTKGDITFYKEKNKNSVYQLNNNKPEET